MTFRSPEWLALSAVLIACLAIYWWTRRYHVQEATYASVWRQALKGYRPMRRGVLQRIVTTLLLFAMFSSLVLALSGARFFGSGRDAIDVVFVIDTSPSMLRDHAGKSSFEVVKQRALAIAQDFSSLDRYWIVASRRGMPMSRGPIEARDLEDQLGLLEPDFEHCEASELAEYVRSRWKGHGYFVLSLSDHDESLHRTLSAGNSYGESIGVFGFDAAFTGIEYLDSTRVQVHYRGGAQPRTRFDDGSDASALVMNGGPGIVEVDRSMLPRGIELSFPDDALTLNNRLRLEALVSPEEQAGVVVVPGEGVNSQFDRAVRDLTRDTGARLTRSSSEDSEVLKQSVVLLDKVENAELGSEVRTVIAFGALPNVFGRTAEHASSIETSGKLVVPAWLGGTSYQSVLETTSIRVCRPLIDSEGWSVLFEEPGLGALVAAKRSHGRTILYVASSFDQGELADYPALALLVRRLIQRSLTPSTTNSKPPRVACTGQDIDVLADDAVDVMLDSSLLNGARHWLARPQAGRLHFSATATPGSYTFSDVEGGSFFYRRELFWLTDASEVPQGPIEAKRYGQLPSLEPASHEHDLFEVLLIVAFVLLAAEWVLYWRGVTD